MSLLVLAIVAAMATASETVQAQNPPATFYGTATPGTRIAAFIEGESCGSAVVNGHGEWVLLIADNTVGCTPAAASVVTFTVNGEVVQQTFIWMPGGATEILFGSAGAASTPPAEKLTAADSTPAPRSTSNRGVDRTTDALVIVVFAAGVVGLVAVVAFELGRSQRSGS